MQSVELARAIDVATSALGTHAQGDLSLGYRQLVLAALGPKKTSGTTQDNPGWVRRTCLAILAVRHVIPIWSERFPNNVLPEQIMSAADAAIRGSEDEKANTNRYNRFQSMIEDLESTHPDDYNITMVAWAALRALATAIYDEAYMESAVDLSLTDEDWDVEMADAGHHACIVAANGYVTDAGSNPRNRRAFWKWWLDEAVPAAYNAVPDE